MFEESLKVFPNPVVESLNIEANIELKNAVLFLYNINGQLVYEQVFTGYTHQINMSPMPAGNYILYIRNKENEADNYTWQIIKQ